METQPPPCVVGQRCQRNVNVDGLSPSPGPRICGHDGPREKRAAEHGWAHEDRRADDDGRRVRSDGLGSLRIRCGHPHAHPEPDVRARESVGRVRGARDRSAVTAVGSSAVGTAAHPPVEVRERARPGPRASGCRQSSALLRPAADHRLAGVLRHNRLGSRGSRRDQQASADRDSDSHEPAAGAEAGVQASVEACAPTSGSGRGHCHPSLVARVSPGVMTRQRPRRS